ncbi:hypothetical protein [Fusobacterium sp.]|uniref:hypothetical protein n=1 Tax=Fusobacterium sp. TaxID=68766 RepID=UPI002E785B0E|nr:hypothetical protein [Fusobacterium sp.]MEE1477272.1 hypothetical protein [Fusobacterium sp.]
MYSSIGDKIYFVTINPMEGQLSCYSKKQDKKGIFMEKRFNRYKHCINKILNKAYEEEKIIFANRECVISNYGRVSFHGEFYKIRRVIKKVLESLDISHKTTTLTSEWITLRNNEIKELMLYVFYADRFLLFLTEKSFSDFNIALEEYNKFINFKLLSNEEKISLLKPVYCRYSKKNENELRNLQIVLRKRLKALKENRRVEYKFPEKLVLYNVPYELIEYSYLRILGNLKLALKESILENSKTYLLGKIEEFDKIEISIIENDRILETYLHVKFYYCGIYLE